MHGEFLNLTGFGDLYTGQFGNIKILLFNKQQIHKSWSGKTLTCFKFSSAGPVFIIEDYAGSYIKFFLSFVP